MYEENEERNGIYCCCLIDVHSPQLSILLTLCSSKSLLYKIDFVKIDLIQNSLIQTKSDQIIYSYLCKNCKSLYLQQSTVL